LHHYLPILITAASLLWVTAAFGTPRLGKNVSALFVEVDSGRVLFSHQAGTLRAPASTLKLVTAAASLAELSHTRPFATKLYSLGDGRVGLQAGLDPSLTVERIWL
jgi:serine-type D-Ala-D-Ala carboxypeptidase/endopeptidase (penicillin-binding protein 4)